MLRLKAKEGKELLHQPERSPQARRAREAREARPIASAGKSYNPVRAKRIRFTAKTYTFWAQDVYVSEVRRIRFGHETYSLRAWKV